jgi:phosphonate transport system permease protein
VKRLKSLTVASHQSRYDSILRGLFLLGVVFILWESYRLSEINIPLLLERGGLEAGKDFLRGLIPPAHSLEFLRFILKPTLDTLFISILGTLLGVFIGFPLSLLAASSITHRGILHLSEEKNRIQRVVKIIPYSAARGLLNLLRSIPELIWALIFVRAVGLGPLPGVLALGVAYGGVLGKLYSEILDSVNPQPIEALHSTGSSKRKIILYGYVPLALPDLIAYTLYRWECGIRAAVVLGFVGAGGIGQEIEISMRMFNYHEVATMIIILCLLVTIVDIISSWIRRVIV